MSMPSHTASEGLSAREKTIIDFLSANPGATKQRVVDALDGKYSRVIVFDTIRNLETYNMIIVQKTKPNSRIHNLYINEKNQILIEINRLSRFETTMMDLLEMMRKKGINFISLVSDDMKKLEIKERINKVSEIFGISLHEEEKILKTDSGKQYIKQANDILKDLTHGEAFKNLLLYYGMFSRLLKIFWLVQQAYSFKALFMWPSQTDNKLYSNKLFQSVLDKLIEIQMKMAEILNDVSSEQNKYVELTEYGFKIDDLYKQSIRHLKKEIISSQTSFEEESRNFRKYGLDREIKNVLNSVYPITNDIFGSK